MKPGACYRNSQVFKDYQRLQDLYQKDPGAYIEMASTGQRQNSFNSNFSIKDRTILVF